MPFYCQYIFSLEESSLQTNSIITLPRTTLKPTSPILTVSELPAKQFQLGMLIFTLNLNISIMAQILFYSHNMTLIMTLSTAFPIPLGLQSPEEKPPSLPSQLILFDNIIVADYVPGTRVRKMKICGFCSQESVLMPVSLSGVSFDHFSLRKLLFTLQCPLKCYLFCDIFLTSSSEVSVWHLLPCIMITCCGRG